MKISKISESMTKRIWILSLLFFISVNVFSQEQVEASGAQEGQLVESPKQNGGEDSDDEKDSIDEKLLDYASKIAGAENLAIAKFNIEGLKRTKRSYMDSLLADFVDKPVTVETMKMVETKLQAQNLFDNIQLSAQAISESQAAVNISFKEKWSFLPLPVGYYSDGAFGIGLFIMDMNALGQHCMAAVGGLYSSSAVMGAFMFQKPPVQKGKLGFSIAANGSKSNHQIANSGNYKVFEYENYYGGIRSSLLLKPTKGTSASVGMGYSFLNPIDSPSIPRINQWSLSASWGISDTSWNGYFVSSNSFSVGSEILFSDNSEQYCAQTFNFDGNVQRAILPKLRLMTSARGFFSNNLYVTNFVGRGSSGLPLLPGKFLTPQIFGLLSGFEAVIAKAKFGMLTFYSVYGVAVARDWDKSFYACHGPEAGIRVYLAKIAFPAFAMGLSYNINENRTQLSISGGASF